MVFHICRGQSLGIVKQLRIIRNWTRAIRNWTQENTAKAGFYHPKCRSALESSTGTSAQIIAANG